MEIKDPVTGKVTTVGDGTAVPGVSGDVTGAPLEGNVREDANASTKNKSLEDKLVEAKLDSRNALVGDSTGSKVPEASDGLQEEIEDKLKDKNPESVKADISAELANPAPGAPRVEPKDPSRTIQRPDGTITTADRPQDTAHYIHGSRVMITDEQKEKFDLMNADLNASADNRNLSDIPLADDYWKKKTELDAFVATLKH